jgi:hypothetical protein
VTSVNFTQAADERVYGPIVARPAPIQPARRLSGTRSTPIGPGDSLNSGQDAKVVRALKAAYPE